MFLICHPIEPMHTGDGFKKNSQVNVKYIISVFVGTTNFLSPSIVLCAISFERLVIPVTLLLKFLETKIKDLETCDSLVVIFFGKNHNELINNFSLHRIE